MYLSVDPIENPPDVAVAGLKAEVEKRERQVQARIDELEHELKGKRGELATLLHAIAVYNRMLGALD